MHAPVLSHAPPTPLAEHELQAQIRRLLSDKLTGQIEVSFLNDRTETIFVADGLVRQVYIRDHRVPDLKWENPIIRFGKRAMNVKSMPARALMFSKVVLEELTPPRPQRSGTNQLKTMFSVAEHNSNPTLFHIQWEHAEGFVLVAGKGIPVRQAVMLTEVGAEEGIIALDQLPAWHEPQCDVFVYRGNIKSQAWLEIHLNIMLAWQSSNILKQYGKLTGGVVVRSILYNVAALATRKGWMVSIDDQQLSDATVFASAAEAGTAYREILSSIKVQMEPVVGSALTRDLLKQSEDTMRDIFRIIEEAFGLIEEAA